MQIQNDQNFASFTQTRLKLEVWNQVLHVQLIKQFQEILHEIKECPGEASSTKTHRYIPSRSRIASSASLLSSKSINAKPGGLRATQTLH
jgi:hypothetical protein